MAVAAAAAAAVTGRSQITSCRISFRSADNSGDREDCRKRLAPMPISSFAWWDATSEAAGRSVASRQKIDVREAEIVGDG